MSQQADKNMADLLLGGSDQGLGFRNAAVLRKVFHLQLEAKLFNKKGQFEKPDQLDQTQVNIKSHPFNSNLSKPAKGESQ